MAQQKQYERVVAEGLTFGQAMVECVEKGNMISRPHWGGYWKFRNFKCFSKPIVAATLITGETMPATPYQDDMIARDWMIVE